MAYTVTITYAGVQAPQSIPFVSPICNLYVPANSYIQTEAYADTVYDTSTRGKVGYIDLMEPYATTSFPFPVPLAQFKVAAVGEEGTVEFTVDSYMEAFFYIEAGKALADQGFTVTVAEAE